MNTAIDEDLVEPTESDLVEIEKDDLLKNWSKTICTKCWSEFDLCNVKYINGNPVCPNCGTQN